MTRKQIAEILGLHIQVVHSAFELCGKEYSEIKEKSATYNGHKPVEFDLEEVLLAMSYARDGKGISELEKCILQDSYSEPKKNETKKFGIEGTVEFLKKIKNYPKKKCCSTCSFCVKACMRNRKPVAKPYCNLWNRFLNKINANPYKDWCNLWEYSNKEPLIFFEAGQPSNLDITGNIKNEVMGFDVSNFHSNSREKGTLVNEIGISSLED